MMKKLKYLAMSGLALLSLSCSTDDESEVFDQPADVRIETTLENYKEQLTSAGDNGWKVRFFPDTTRAGGWTFLMRFNEDNTVEMIGDVFEDPEVQEGYYELNNSQGPVLNFGSYLPISELVNPSSSYPDARYGSNEFIFVDDDFSGDVELISKRNGSPFILEPATAEDWNNISAHLATEDRFSGGETPPSVYRYFELSDGSETLISQMSYDSPLRFMNLRSQGSTVVISSGHGVAFSKDSVFFDSPVRFKGEEISKLVYDEETGDFYGESNGVVAKLYYSDSPAFFNENYLIPNSERWAYVASLASYLGDPGDQYTTDAYFNRFLQTYLHLGQYGLRLNSVQLHFNYNEPGDNRLIYSVTAGETNMSIHVYLITERKDKKLYLSSDGIAFTNPAINFVTLEDLDPLHGFWTNPEGLFVDSPGTFLNFTNTAYTFVSASNPNERVLTFFNQP